MNSAEKQRILIAYERASLVAGLASRGFYVVGEVWRDRVCGLPVREHESEETPALTSDDLPRPAARDSDPRPDVVGETIPAWTTSRSGGTTGNPRR